MVAVTSARAIRRVTFVKTSSATHGFNMDQRFVELPFTDQGGGQLKVQFPPRAADAPPGMWMMFALDDRGVPSEAKLMRVNVAPATPLAGQTISRRPATRPHVGDTVNLTWTQPTPTATA